MYRSMTFANQSQRILLSAFFAVLVFVSSAQTKDTIAQTIIKVETIQKEATVTTIASHDSLLLVIDSIPGIKKIISGSLLSANSLITKLPEPIVAKYRDRDRVDRDMIFYLILALSMFLGILKFSFPKYFQNMFRVFFNTSLRQKQLTDQLLQTPLPSLLLNIFFFFSSSLFIYLLLGYWNILKPESSWNFYFVILGLLVLIYFAKFCFIKFVGWLTALTREANDYIFIVFLVNKILGVCLLPFLPMMAFSASGLVRSAMLIAIVVVFLIIAIRFFRSYGLAEASLKIHRFHFLLYITALEVLPLIILYKAALSLLDKNL